MLSHIVEFPKNVSAIKTMIVFTVSWMDVFGLQRTFVKMLFSRNFTHIVKYLIHTPNPQKNHSVKKCAFGRGKVPNGHGIAVKNVKTEIA